MHEAATGAKEAGGLMIGILPFAEYDGKEVSPAIDIPVLTGVGEARNVINVLTSRVVIVCGMSSGTASEVALALRARLARRGGPYGFLSPIATAFRRKRRLADMGLFILCEFGLC